MILCLHERSLDLVSFLIMFEQLVNDLSTCWLLNFFWCVLFSFRLFWLSAHLRSFLLNEFQIRHFFLFVLCTGFFDWFHSSFALFERLNKADWVFKFGFLQNIFWRLAQCLFWVTALNLCERFWPSLLRCNFMSEFNLLMGCCGTRKRYWLFLFSLTLRLEQRLSYWLVHFRRIGMFP